MLVQRGALSPADYFVVGQTWGKVKLLQQTDGGKGGGARLKRAGPSTPVRLSGLRELPQTGDVVLGVANEARAKEVGSDSHLLSPTLPYSHRLSPTLTYSHLLSPTLPYSHLLLPTLPCSCLLSPTLTKHL